jgi:hypothetical protein
VLGRNYFPKGFIKMVQIRYWMIRASLTYALVLSSAVAAGWKWNKLP